MLLVVRAPLTWMWIWPGSAPIRLSRCARTWLSSFLFSVTSSHFPKSLRKILILSPMMKGKRRWADFSHSSSLRT